MPFRTARRALCRGTVGVSARQWQETEERTPRCRRRLTIAPPTRSAQLRQSRKRLRCWSCWRATRRYSMPRRPAAGEDGGPWAQAPSESRPIMCVGPWPFLSGATPRTPRWSARGRRRPGRRASGPRRQSQSLAPAPSRWTLLVLGGAVLVLARVLIAALDVIVGRYGPPVPQAASVMRPGPRGGTLRREPRQPDAGHRRRRAASGRG